MVSTFPPLKYSAKIHLRNFSEHAFGQNTPLPPKNSAWCKMSFTLISGTSWVAEKHCGRFDDYEVAWPAQSFFGEGTIGLSIQDLD